MNTENSIWTERYRPDTLEGYIGNETLRSKLEQYISTQDIPHLLFYGTPGTGKTTAAKILVKNIDCDYMFINASDERGIDTIREKVKGFAVTSGFKPLKIVVLDEMCAITPDAQRALRNLMEAYSSSTRFILTANYIERIIDPLVSRTQVYKLTPPSKKEVAVRLVEILRSEAVQYDKAQVVQIVNAYYPDIRKCINTMQLQTMDGVLKVSEEELINQDVKLKILDLMTSNLPVKDKTNQIRQVVADSGIRDFAELYRMLYDNVELYAPNKIPEAVIAIDNGQYRDYFVPDKELCFVATLYNILIN